MTERDSGHVRSTGAGGAPSAIDGERPAAWVPATILAGAALIAVLGAGMLRRSVLRANRVTLDATPRPVSVVTARAATFRPSRHFPATLEALASAHLGPQRVSAYVESVAVRPGAVVKKGDVLATLDCRKSASKTQARSMQAKAVEVRQAVSATEAARLGELQRGGFVATNDVDRKLAESSSDLATLEALRARVRKSAIEADDCQLKAPFDGEVSERLADPGAWVHPGDAILRVVDRSSVRAVMAVPEKDFAIVLPGTVVHVRHEATGTVTSALVSRRAPGADPVDRLIHVEIDLPGQGREVPVGTTLEVIVEAAAAEEALELPLHAASIRGEAATVFVVAGDVANKHEVRILGEASGSVFVAPGSLRAGDRVILEGRPLLSDADRVEATDRPPSRAAAQ